MLYFIIGLIFGFIFAGLYRYQQTSQRALAVDTAITVDTVQPDTSKLEAEREALLSALDQCRAQTDMLRAKLDALQQQPAAAEPIEIDLEALKQSLPKATSDPDDLKQIKGIGPVIEKTLNEFGVTTFRQIALLSETQIEQVASALKVFPDRIRRDDWIAQAQTLHTAKYNTPI